MRKNLLFTSFLGLALIILVPISSFSESRYSGDQCRDVFFTTNRFPVQGMSRMQDAYARAGVFLERMGVPFGNNSRIDQEFMNTLPRLDQSKGSSVEEQLQIYVDKYLAGRNLRVDPNPILSRDSRIYFLRNNRDEAIFVIKIFPPYPSALLHEVSSGQVLTRLVSKFFSFVQIRDVFQMQIGRHMFPVMLADGADGESFQHLISSGPSASKMIDQMQIAARGFFEFHHSSVQKMEIDKIRQYRVYDFEKTRRYIDEVRFESVDRSLGIASSTSKIIKQKLDAIALRGFHNTFPYLTYTHGDAHIANVFVSGRSIPFIDYMSGEWSFWRKADAELPAGDPLGDVGRFLESWHAEGLAKGLDSRALLDSEDAFMKTYAELWNVPVSDIEDAILSHRIRIALVRLVDFGGLTPQSEKVSIVRDFLQRFGQ